MDVIGSKGVGTGVSDKSRRWRKGDAGWRGERRRAAVLLECQDAGKGCGEPPAFAADQTRVRVESMENGSTGLLNR